MATLLLRLSAPIQAWGDESKYDIRGTRNEPTKSGIIGMLAAAMGYRRDSGQIKEMASKLRLGIRVDQPGMVICDFHTARAPKYGKGYTLSYHDNGTPVMEKNPYVTERYYLCDACFLVGVECDDSEYLGTIEKALKTPKFPLFLGRRSCPPSMPLVLGVKNDGLESTLEHTAWVAADWFKDRQRSIRARVMIETEQGKAAYYTQMDQPVSFNPIHRQYTLRGVEKEHYVLLGMPEHDPMAALQEE